jgi:hypothetical protein
MTVVMGPAKLMRELSCGSSRGGTRTPDPVINSHLLYQLSYSGKRNKCNDLRRRTQAPLRRVTTSPVQARRA